VNVAGIHRHCIVKNTAKNADCYTPALSDRTHPAVLYAQSEVRSTDNTRQVVADY